MGGWLLLQAEALAKAQFARRKEPYDCMLLYVALGRKPLLLSLFRCDAMAGYPPCRVLPAACACGAGARGLNPWSQCGRQVVLLYTNIPLYCCTSALAVPLYCRQAGNVKVSDFLLKDFTKDDPKRSAAKNAFALLGQHK